MPTRQSGDDRYESPAIAITSPQVVAFFCQIIGVTCQFNLFSVLYYYYMSRRPIKITADNRTKSIKEWSFETGLAISTIESRRKRCQSEQVSYTTEEIVGLVKIKHQFHQLNHRISPKPSINKSKERNQFQIRMKFSRKPLVR